MNTTPIYIRPAIYRNKQGFTVKSRMGGVFGTSIFVETRKAAEICKQRIRNGEEVTMADLTA